MSWGIAACGCAANARLREVIRAKDTEVAVVRAQMEAYQAQIEELRAEMDALRARLRGEPSSDYIRRSDLRVSELVAPLQTALLASRYQNAAE